MLKKKLATYRRLKDFRRSIFYRNYAYFTRKAFAWIFGMFFVCVLIMSLMIVKVSSSTTTHHQNQTTAHSTGVTIRTRSIQSFNISLEDNQTTTTTASSTTRKILTARTATTTTESLTITTTIASDVRVRDLLENKKKNNNTNRRGTRRYSNHRNLKSSNETKVSKGNSDRQAQANARRKNTRKSRRPSSTTSPSTITTLVTTAEIAPTSTISTETIAPKVNDNKNIRRRTSIKSKNQIKNATASDALRNMQAEVLQQQSPKPRQRSQQRQRQRLGPSHKLQQEEEQEETVEKQAKEKKKQPHQQPEPQSQPEPRQAHVNQTELHAKASETAYLLERDSGDGSAHEQPIYGTWRMKAKRAQASFKASKLQRTRLRSTAATNATTTTAVPSAATPSKTLATTSPAALSSTTMAARSISALTSSTISTASSTQSSTVTAIKASSAAVVNFTEANAHPTLAASAALTVGESDHFSHLDGNRYSGANSINIYNNSKNHWRGSSINQQEAIEHHNHHYERLPKRSNSTMTPVKSELRDQIPRPPRLTTSRQPSLLVRRQYSDTPQNVSFRDPPEQKPKPFHFPYDGPMPEEFKKAEAERAEVNSIQDILQQLHLGGVPSKVPPMLMMPTGLHIAGSFKNLKSSGFTNFFRNKRNKKHMQLTVPVPIPMQIPLQFFGGYPPGPPLAPQPPPPPLPMFYGIMPAHSYQQRIAMDQFFPFKPRSPNEINLLAMQQHQFQDQRVKHKKKPKKPASAMNAASSSYFWQPNSYRPMPPATPADFLLSNNVPWFALNATQRPKLKRVPFKVNLDIYPVVPPSRDSSFKFGGNGLPLEDYRIPAAAGLRPATALRNPFTDFATFQYPLAASVAPIPYGVNSYNNREPSIAAAFSPIKFPTAVEPAGPAQSSHSHVIFPDQISKQTKQSPQKQQQHPQQQPQPHQQQYFLPLMHPQQSSFMPVECLSPSVQPTHLASAASNQQQLQTNGNPNQIMVHLNVFPKPKPPSPSASLPSTNPFYSNSNSLVNRNSISSDRSNFHVPQSPIEPRQLVPQQQANYSQAQQSQQRDQSPPPPPPLPITDQQQQQINEQTARQKRISRSDDDAYNSQYLTQSSSFIDFEHPIVADEIVDLPQSAALIDNKIDAAETSPHYGHIEARHNGFISSNDRKFYSDKNSNINLAASEPQSASLFRFPVEDLIQFQVDDAL